MSVPEQMETELEDPVTISEAEAIKDEGNRLFKDKKYNDALQKYSKAISMRIQYAVYYGNRSACYMMLGQYPLALQDAQNAVKLDQMFQKGYVRVIKCCIVLGELVTAGVALQKLQGIDSQTGLTSVKDEKTTLSQLSQHQADYFKAYETRDFRKSLYCLDRALSIATHSNRLKLLRAECLANLGRYIEAQEVASEILRSDNLNVDALYVRGLAFYYEDNIDKAFNHFQQALRLAPDHVKAKDVYRKAKLLKLKKEEGNAAFKNGELNKAYDLYTEALQIDSCNKITNAKIFFNRATVLAKLKRVKESAEDCTSAIDLDENYFKAIFRRAKCYMELEKYEEAVKDLELANNMEQGNRDVMEALQNAKKELKMSKRKDYYKILEVSKDANDDEIKKAYRKRALIHHPDKNSSASEDERKEHERKFKDIGEAYAVLSDPKKKSNYDNGYDLEDMDGHEHHHGFAGGIDPHDIFQMFFTAGGMDSEDNQHHSHSSGHRGGRRGRGRASAHQESDGNNNRLNREKEKKVKERTRRDKKEDLLEHGKDKTQKARSQNANVNKIYDDERLIKIELSNGWIKHMVQRRKGVSMGKYDVYILSPDGKRFRSRNELQKFFDENNITDYDQSLFDFRSNVTK